MARFVNPFPQHFDLNGDPNAFYKAFFGEPNQDPKLFPKSPFSDEALEIPIAATQVLDATGGYGIDIFLKGLYSIRIETPLGSLWRETPSTTGIGIGEAGVNFETVADMVAEAALTVGTFVTVQDYATDRDSGVLFFKVVAAGTGTPDGGSFIDLTGASLQAEQIFGSSRSLKQFGAVGDGTTAGGGTDDTAALNATYADAVANAVPMHLDVGNFRFTSQLSWNGEIDVRGAGRNQCALIKDGSFAGIRLADSDGAFYTDFAVIGATGNTGIGIDIFHGQRITMSQIKIRDMGTAGDTTSHGIVMRAGNQAGFYNFKITSNGGDGLRIQSGTGEFGQSANAGTYNNFDLNGNYNNFNSVEGATNIIVGAICQNAVNKNIQVLSPSERNSIVTYNETENVTSTAAGTANAIMVLEGQVDDIGTLNRILKFNAAGLEIPIYERMFAALVYIQNRDRGVEAPNSSPWTLTELGNVSNSILDFVDGGPASKPGILNIKHNATPAQRVSMTLDGSLTVDSNITTAGAFLNSTVTTLAAGATPNVASSNVFIIDENTSKTNFLGGLPGQTIKLKAAIAVSIEETANISLGGGIPFPMSVGDTLTLTQYTTNLWDEDGRKEV